MRTSPPLILLLALLLVPPVVCAAGSAPEPPASAAAAPDALEFAPARPGRVALGASLVRRTDHNELQQVDDLENTLAMLLWRNDYRDYFERDGLGAYLAWNVPDFSTVSFHLRRDAYRSLPLDSGTVS